LRAIYLSTIHVTSFVISAVFSLLLHSHQGSTLLLCFISLLPLNRFPQSLPCRCVLSDRPMATSQDARSACGVDHSADDLRPETTQPVAQYDRVSQQSDTSPDITIKAESTPSHTTESASQRPARTKRKGTQTLALSHITTNAAQHPAPQSTLQATLRSLIKRTTMKIMAKTELNSTIRILSPYLRCSSIRKPSSKLKGKLQTPFEGSQSMSKTNLSQTLSRYTCTRDLWP
jgi:hypothetical protein